MSELLPFRREPQSITGLSAVEDCKVLEISFSQPVTSAELINTWIYIKNFVPSNERPEGWEPIKDKDDPGKWEPAS